MKTRTFTGFLKSLAIGVGALLLAVSVVYAATTIGTNISTTGTLGSTGLATFTTVTSTSATTTAYLYVGPDITEPTAGWDFSYGDLIVSDDAFFNSQATTSASLWVGSGGTVNNLSMTGGDLYVQDDVEIDDSLWFVHGTTTDSMSIGGYASTTGNLFSRGGTADFATGTATTTSGLFVRIGASATTTLGIGKNSEDGSGVVVGCLELVTPDGGYAKCWVPKGGTALQCAAGRCKD